MRTTRQTRQGGVALITAVMVVAFASTIGAAMMVKHHLAVHRTGNAIQQVQAWWYLVGLEQWAATLLDRDREDNQVDHLGEPWAQPVDFLPVDEGALAGRLLDLQGCFNLNTLIRQGAVDADRVAQFQRLLRAIDGLRAGQAEELTAAIIDWLDADTEPTFPGGAEDGTYSTLDSPYRAANRPMSSVTELRLIQGVDAKLYAALLPHVCVRPGDHVINVNTASAAVLMSLADDMTPADAEGIIARRIDQPFESTEAFVADELLAGRGISADAISVQSEYFQAEATASIGNVRLSMVSQFRRPEGARTRAVARSLNVL